MIKQIDEEYIFYFDNSMTDIQAAYLLAEEANFEKPEYIDFQLLAKEIDYAKEYDDDNNCYYINFEDFVILFDETQWYVHTIELVHTNYNSPIGDPNIYGDIFLDTSDSYAIDSDDKFILCRYNNNVDSYITDVIINSFKTIGEVKCFISLLAEEMYRKSKKNVEICGEEYIPTDAEMKSIIQEIITTM